MPLIQLPAATIKLISSSQVITSVSSVVKELVENAIDAGASSIDIKLEENGLSKIEVKDDGSGIFREDVKNVCQPSYTSKIQNFRDLESLTSYGFRGEALSALCQVSDVTITTRTAEDEHAMVYVFNKNGGISSSKLSHHLVGTIIVASNLFKNLPVRKQFLKSGRRANDELKRVENIVKLLAVISPKLRVTLFHNKHLLWQKNSVSSLKQSLMHAVGHTISSRLEELSTSVKKISINMLVPKRDVNDLIVQSNVDCIMTFINKRPVRHKKLEHLLMKHLNTHFDGQIPAQKYPHCLLSIEIPSSDLDVNLEPNKSKVLFNDEEQVLNLMEKLLCSYYELNDKVDKLPLSSTIQKSTTEGSDSGERPQKKAKLGTAGITDEPVVLNESEVDICRDRSLNETEQSLLISQNIARDALSSTTNGSKDEIKNSDSSRNCSSIKNEADEDNGVNNNLKQCSDAITTHQCMDVVSTDELFDVAIDSLSSQPFRQSLMKFVSKNVEDELDQDCETDIESLLNHLQDSNTSNDAMIAHSRPPEIVAPQTNVMYPLLNESNQVSYGSKDQTNVLVDLHDEVIIASENMLCEEIDTAESRTLKQQGHEISNHSVQSESAISSSQWDAIDKASEKWSRQEPLNTPPEQKKTSPMTRLKWSTGQVRLANGRLLQGSSVLLPAAASANPSPSPTLPMNRSVSSQMGQKDNSAFTKFAREMRPQIFQEHPGIDFTRVAGLMVSRWRALKEEERARYEEMARETESERKRKCFDKQPTEVDQKKKKEKIERFQNLLNNSIKSSVNVSQSTVKQKIYDKKQNRKEVKIDILATDLTRKLYEDNSSAESAEFSLIGQLKPSKTWIYRQGTEIGIIRHWGLQEVVIFDKLMKNHSVPLTPLEKPIVINERSLGPDLWRFLVSLDKSFNGLTNKVTISNQCISKNGFTIEVNEGNDQVFCRLTAVPLFARTFEIPELIETLQLMQRNGPNCALHLCRPIKIIHTLEADAVRMTRESPALDRDALDELLTYWHLHINKDEYTCLHHKPIFTAVHQLKLKAQVQKKWESILLQCEK